jgi:hypothetical protein
LEDRRYDAIAARSGKGESAAGRHVDLARERLAQQRSRAEVTRAHGGFGKAEAFGGLLDRHLLDFAHHEDRAKRDRQLVDLALEHGAQLGARRGVFG